MIKKFLLLLLCVIIGPKSYAQENVPSELEASFSAIIVRDIDKSIQWYSEALGFVIVSRDEVKVRTLRQANLVNGQFKLELIEITGAIAVTDLLEEKNKGAQVTGFFKFGFDVVNIDEWMHHFERKNIQLRGGLVTDPITHKKMVIVLDPDGNRIQLFEK